MGKAHAPEVLVRICNLSRGTSDLPTSLDHVWGTSHTHVHV